MKALPQSNQKIYKIESKVQMSC